MQSNSVRQSQESKDRVSHTSGFCICGHSRADHSSDEIDITERLGHCLANGCGCEVFWHSESESNAHLIAAAPQLLESLEEFVALANFDADTIPKTTEEWDAMVAKAETVIRKAKGGQ